MTRRRAVRLSFLASAFCLLVLSPLAARAQLEVTVTDTAGQTLVGARVEVWRISQLLIARSTNSAGVVTFGPLEVTDATDVLVRRIGYAPRRASLIGIDDKLRVQLDLLARPLPSMIVSASVDACPQTDSPEARALLARVAARYSEPSFEGRHTTLDQRMGTVEEPEVGFVDDSEPRLGSRMYTSEGMLGAHEQLASRGYAYAAPDSHDYDLFGRWQYAQLDAELAGHFATNAFSEAHTFTVASRGASMTTLRFCARDRRGSGLDGMLQLSEADGFVDSNWRYWNPRGDSEAAGGAATFSAVRADRPSMPLLSTSGLFWRQLPSGRYLQRLQDFDEWRLAEGEDANPGTVSLVSQCHPPPNYVLCSVTVVRGGAGAPLSTCFSMAYRCFDD